MPHIVRCVIALLGLSLLAIPAFATDSDVYVPAELSDWIPWVLEKHPEQTCPFQSSGDYRLCQAPSSLRLTLDDAGGTFALQGYAFQAGWVPLPGDELHWPQDVQRDSQPVARRSGVAGPGPVLVTPPPRRSPC